MLPTETLTAIFDVHVAFRDPGIVPMFGGMFNALLGFGDCFPHRRCLVGNISVSVKPLSVPENFIATLRPSF